MTDPVNDAVVVFIEALMENLSLTKGRLENLEKKVEDLEKHMVSCQPKEAECS